MTKNRFKALEEPHPSGETTPADTLNEDSSLTDPFLLLHKRCIYI